MVNILRPRLTGFSTTISQGLKNMFLSIFRDSTRLVTSACCRAEWCSHKKCQEDGPKQPERISCERGWWAQWPGHHRRERPVSARPVQLATSSFLPLRITGCWWMTIRVFPLGMKCPSRTAWLYRTQTRSPSSIQWSIQRPKSPSRCRRALSQLPRSCLQCQRWTMSARRKRRCIQAGHLPAADDGEPLKTKHGNRKGSF